MIVERDGKHPAASALPAQMQALLRRIPPIGWRGKSPRTHVAYVASARHSIVRGVCARADSSGAQPGRRSFTAAVDCAALQARESLRDGNVQRRPRPLGLIIDAHARSGARHVISQLRGSPPSPSVCLGKSHRPQSAFAKNKFVHVCGMQFFLNGPLGWVTLRSTFSAI